ncbi:MAG: hypothetical protein GF384_02120 [Elusimicrobia bacterium]|nr:hypothetical protein [Elusimicrobiota bacterium]MBD3411777.1 hypothetical protein [Elusimicrobiota bacterium]
MYITHENLNKLLNNLEKDYSVFVPIKKGEQRFYTRYAPSIPSMVIGEVRAFEPLKMFFTRAREKVAEGFKSDIPFTQDKPIAVIGVKACDLKGFKVQDFVYGADDCIDPIYRKMRDENLIISADCTCAIDTCFCTALGIQPYPKQDFDLNLSPISGGYIVQTGSEKGKKTLESNTSLFSNASPDANREQTDQRSRVTEAVNRNCSTHRVPHQDSLNGAMMRNYESKIWEDEAKTCVECGACNSICPTCHCFLLYDRKNEATMARYRIWDSCMLKDFARVAGGANPRSKLWMRLRNRFEKKFDFFPKVADVYACTGCGRCISACPAKIDIRKVLQRLVNNA